MADPVLTPLGASTLNRDWRIEVDTGTSTTPVWTVVRGRTDFKPAQDSNLEDDSDMDSGGYGSKTKTAEDWSLELKVARKATVGASPTYDLGQETLRLAAQQMGPANTVHVRWYKLGAVRTEAFEGYAACSYEPEGGDQKGLDAATIKLNGQGKRLSITHPYPLS